MDWTEAVFRIKGPDDIPGSNGKIEAFGTGFACGKNGDAMIVVTCWHVVREIGEQYLRIRGIIAANCREPGAKLLRQHAPEYLRIKGWPCELVSSDGDNDLDLAVLQVTGLATGDLLELAPDPDSDELMFVTYGYEPDGRKLSGTLGARISRQHASGDDVMAWDYYLREGARAFEKVKDGYSGAPICNASTHRVVAVITHRQGTDKGFAIDIANLERVYPPAAELLAPAQAGGHNEYALETDVPLVKMLDHSRQLGELKGLPRGAGAHAVIWFEACSEDWPSYLADHACLDPYPEDEAHLPVPIELNLRRSDRDAFREALFDKVPGACTTTGGASLADVSRWLGGPLLRIIYVPFVLDGEWRHLDEVMAGAQETLGGLGELAAGTRVLVLFACMPDGARAPWFWTWFGRHRLQRRCPGARNIPAMRPLTKGDIENWHSAFPSRWRQHYDRDRLKGDLLTLFEKRPQGIRYQEVRKFLVDDDALGRARRRPDTPRGG